MCECVCVCVCNDGPDDGRDAEVAMCDNGRDDEVVVCVGESMSAGWPSIVAV